MFGVPIFPQLTVAFPENHSHAYAVTRWPRSTIRSDLQSPRVAAARWLPAFLFYSGQGLTGPALTLYHFRFFKPPKWLISLHFLESLEMREKIYNHDQITEL